MAKKKSKRPKEENEPQAQLVGASKAVSESDAALHAIDSFKWFAGLLTTVVIVSVIGGAATGWLGLNTLLQAKDAQDKLNSARARHVESSAILIISDALDWTDMVMSQLTTDLWKVGRIPELPRQRSQLESIRVALQQEDGQVAESEMSALLLEFISACEETRKIDESSKNRPSPRNRLSRLEWTVAAQWGRLATKCTSNSIPQPPKELEKLYPTGSTLWTALKIEGANRGVHSDWSKPARIRYAEELDSLAAYSLNAAASVLTRLARRKSEEALWRYVISLLGSAEELDPEYARIYINRSVAYNQVARHYRADTVNGVVDGTVPKESLAAFDGAVEESIRYIDEALTLRQKPQSLSRAFNNKASYQGEAAELHLRLALNEELGRKARLASLEQANSYLERADKNIDKALTFFPTPPVSNTTKAEIYVARQKVEELKRVLGGEDVRRLSKDQIAFEIQTITDLAVPEHQRPFYRFVGESFESIASDAVLYRHVDYLTEGAPTTQHEMIIFQAEKAIADKFKATALQ